MRSANSAHRGSGLISVATGGFVSDSLIPISPTNGQGPFFVFQCDAKGIANHENACPLPRQFSAGASSHHVAARLEVSGKELPDLILCFRKRRRFKAPTMKRFFARDVADNRISRQRWVPLRISTAWEDGAGHSECAKTTDSLSRCSLPAKTTVAETNHPLDLEKCQDLALRNLQSCWTSGSAQWTNRPAPP